MKIFIKGDGERAKAFAVKQTVSEFISDKSEVPINLTELEEFISYDIETYNVNAKVAAVREKCAFDSFVEQLPLDESVNSHQFGVVETETDELLVGCPVMKVITDKAEYVVVYDNFVVNEGEILNNDNEYGNYVSTVGLGRNPIVSFFVKEFVKALVKKAIRETYKGFFPKEDTVLKDELKKLKDEIKQIFQQSKYENLEDKLIQARAWLRDTYSEKLISFGKGQKLNIEEIRNDLKLRQEELQGIAEVVKQRTPDADLNNCDYLTRVKVMLYATCTTLRIILFKEQAFWQNVMKNNGNSNYDNDADINELQNYITTTASTLKEYIEKLKNGRYGKISDVKLTEHKAYYAQAKGGFYKHWVVLEWVDNFESHHNDDPFAGDKIMSEKTVSRHGKDANVDEVKQNMNNDRQNHINDVKHLFELHIEEPLQNLIENLAQTTATITE